MENGGALKVLRLFAFSVALMRAQSLPDPADLLEQLRDKVIARVPPIGYTCIATIDRSFRSLPAPPVIPKSCEQISADRKKKRTQLQLDKTDRLRLQVTVTNQGEIFAWTGTRPSFDLEQIVNASDLGTGPLAVHLDAILANPLVLFHLLGQSATNLEFGFRVPMEASSYLVKAGAQWRETGYFGSLTIDPVALELKRVTVETEQLPAETSLCESSTVMEYPTSGEGMLLPDTIRSRHLYPSGAETEWFTRFSDCRDAPEKIPDRPPPPALFSPALVRRLRLALATPIDTATAAVGDVMTATLLETVEGPANAIAPVGATLTGRIMRMEHQVRSPRSFLIWLKFDTIEVNGVVWSIHARLARCEDSRLQESCSVATMSDQPRDRAFLFQTKSPNILIPAGYKSRWLTGD